MNVGVYSPEVKVMVVGETRRIRCDAGNLLRDDQTIASVTKVEEIGGNADLTLNNEATNGAQINLQPYDGKEYNVDAGRALLVTVSGQQSNTLYGVFFTFVTNDNETMSKGAIIVGKTAADLLPAYPG